ncbi:hypothetical protein [Citrobacter freundii]|uniref:hypothetical protein n=1 Tax=Citrobacter freundii TaxID=546 RepID=UPI00388E2AEC
MGSNIIELAKLGHERAAELKASCGSVDVRSVAQLISDLATQLEVQYVCAEESQRELRSADITMQNLEAKLKQSKIDADCYKKGMEASNVRLVQLAAENVTLNDKMNKLATWPGIEFYSSAWDFCNLDGNDALEFMCDVKTPAADAFLDEVRASAVDEVCLKISNEIVNCYQDEQVGLDTAATICGDFAAQLRHGAAL